MILKDDKQNPESFFVAIARHLSPGGSWRLTGGLVTFGAGEFWHGTIKSNDGCIVGVEIDNDELDAEDIRTIEDAIALLEGLASSDGEDDEDEGTDR